MKSAHRLDPTRTSKLRKKFLGDVRKRFRKLKGRINKLIIEEDAFGIGKVSNNRWAFRNDSEKVEEFQKWLILALSEEIIGPVQASNVEDAYWYKYIQEGYLKGAGRSYSDVKKRGIISTAEDLAFFQGGRQEFLRQSFNNPIALDKVKLMAGRVLTDLEGVDQAVATQLSRTLTDGLVQGKGPREVAREINKEIDSIGKNRASTIARTETIRAHAEGQLDSLEKLGVEEVGVAVEWSTTEDELVCPLCVPLEGIVLKIKESRGMLPRHPNCRCAWVPANVGEDTKDQKRSASAIKKARDESIAAEGKKKDSLADKKKKTPWIGADKRIAKARPKDILDDDFDTPAPSTIKPGSRLKILVQPKTSEGIDALNIIEKEVASLHQKYPALNDIPVASIEIIPGKSFKADTIVSPDNPNYGTYTHKKNEIRMSSKLARDGQAKIGGFNVGQDLRTGTRHEYGHHVMDHLDLPKDPRHTPGPGRRQRPISWQRVSENYVGKDKDIVVSDFARKNRKELYAESFAVYTDPNYKRGDLPKDIEEFFDLSLNQKKKSKSSLEKTEKKKLDIKKPKSTKTVLKEAREKAKEKTAAKTEKFREAERALKEAEILEEEEAFAAIDADAEEEALLEIRRASRAEQEGEAINLPNIFPAGPVLSDEIIKSYPQANPVAVDTFGKYQLREGVFTPERTILQEGIIARSVTSATPVKKPVAYMTGGGPASGKSVLFRNGNVKLPDNIVTIDSDEIKKSLPEFVDLTSKGNQSAAAFAHEESSMLSKRILSESARTKRNLFLDGTGDNGFDKLKKKVDSMRSGGQRVVAHYVTVDTEVAVARNVARAKKTGRLVPNQYVRNVHAAVSNVLPKAVEENLFDEVTLWDTNTDGKVIKVMSSINGETVIHNEDLWTRFKDKAKGGNGNANN